MLFRSEAWLAFLAIVVWHLYHTMFKPSVYPMNPAWLSGRMPKHMYVNEHAEGPRLKARTFITHYEEEESADQEEQTLDAVQTSARVLESPSVPEALTVRKSDGRGGTPR